jgi:flagellin
VRIGQIGQIASQSNTVAAGATSGSDTFQVGTGPITTISASSNYAGTAPGQTSDSAYAKAAAVTAAAVPGLTATAANSQGYAAAGVLAANAYTLVVNGTTVVNKAAAATALTTQNIVDSVNSNSSTTGVTAALQGANIIFNTTDGRNITINQTFTAGDGLGAGATGTLNGVTYAAGGALTTATDTIDRGTVTFSANDSISYAGGTAGSATSLGFAGQNVAVAKDNTTLSSLNVKTIAGANDAIKRVDSALASVSAVQANLGAIQNRFTSAISTIQSTSQNLTSSRSRIQDADFAAETASMSRANILQQAGISVLSQANSAPQSVLSLLK